ncbi:MAG: hypothetical protein WC593_04445 [Methanoregula sp.]
MDNDNATHSLHPKHDEDPAARVRTKARPEAERIRTERNVPGRRKNRCANNPGTYTLY